MAPAPHEVVARIGHHVAQNEDNVRQERIEIASRRKKADDDGHERSFKAREREQYPVAIVDNKRHQGPEGHAKQYILQAPPSSACPSAFLTSTANACPKRNSAPPQEAPRSCLR